MLEDALGCKDAQLPNGERALSQGLGFLSVVEVSFSLEYQWLKGLLEYILYELRCCQ